MLQMVYFPYWSGTIWAFMPVSITRSWAGVSMYFFSYRSKQLRIWFAMWDTSFVSLMIRREPKASLKKFFCFL